MYCTDLVKILSGVSRNFCYHGLGKRFQVLQDFSRFCMTWQGALSFVSLGKQVRLHRKTLCKNMASVPGGENDTHPLN